MQTKLDGGEGKIKNEIEYKREEGEKCQLFLKKLPKNPTIGDGDKEIEKGPGGTKKPGRRRPGRFDKLLIPSICRIHKEIIITLLIVFR